MRTAPLAPLARVASLTRLVPLARHATLARSAALSALAAASLALTACDPGAGGTASPTTSATSSVGATLTPSPSASPSETAPTLDPHPPVSDLYITTSGLLPLTIGQAIVGNPGEAMLEWNPAFCDPEVSGPGDLGRWVAAYPVTAEGGKPFYVDSSEDGVLHRIDIVSPDLATPEGIHIGSPVSDLVAAYPGLVMGTAGWDTIHVYWIQDAHGTVVFETDTSNIDGSTGPDHVQFIRVLAPGPDVDWTVSQSDNIAGGCL